MGFYFFSSVLLVRASLPSRHRGGIESAVGGLGFAFLHHWFDTLFLSSAALTAASLVASATLFSHRRRLRLDVGSSQKVSGERQRHAFGTAPRRDVGERSARLSVLGSATPR